MSSRIKIISEPGTEQHAEDLAAAIQSRFGMDAHAVHPERPEVNPRDSEKLGRLLDTLAVLREVEETLSGQAVWLILDHPELVRGSANLSVEDRIENTISNRTVVRATYGDSRPVYPPEQMILAGAAAAMGGEPQHLGALVYLSAQHASVTEGPFREGLNHPEQSTIELERQIQARIAHPTERTEPESEYEPGDD
ncbi:hypothetical protein [Sulfobacillus harzensis]|uniref:Uncharacterized protein n=1 Tax=Sulfobacillus harzensis TaxID=2729629 RepID=A0A7Y0L6M2_9FIRM|nr:hypothetical protein [Sulfobacillus harzensis]NMP23998.1 hypothetical protein [Sulfobacillus harzensis]